MSVDFYYQGAGWRDVALAEIRVELAKAIADLASERAKVKALRGALVEARAMLRSCALDEPDAGYQAAWDRGLTTIDAALAATADPIEAPSDVHPQGGGQ